MAEKKNESLGCGVLALLVVGLIYGGAQGIYDWADDQGWVPHSHTASITYPSHGWEVGEYLNCAGVKVGEAVTLDCSRTMFETGTVREMDTKISAKLTTDGVNLRCQRNQDSIACSLIPAPPPAPTPAQSTTEHTQTEPVQTEAVQECRTRFWAKGIQEIDGKPVEAVCKENQDRQPRQ
jgi:hypothetical protein